MKETILLMKTIDVNQALSQITKLFEIASIAEEIVITKNNQPIVKLNKKN